MGHTRAESGKGDRRMPSQGVFTDAITSTASPDLSLHIGPPSIITAATSAEDGGFRTCETAASELASTFPSRASCVLPRLKSHCVRLTIPPGQ
ncbi:hypothetical protein C4D60_Mb02t08450 [Musa balbisiana]|uniref:Uncharacterized protein n=1 Tax=Musa balbisiana TaxID=52838 RepID=A0A4S8IA33_MUSBA|nr:hypothetical protein C4D60_Mb02t08450 [Musa balbisiana]